MKLKQHYLNIALCTLLNYPGAAQSVSTLMGGRAAGMAYASATLADVWSFSNNIGGLARVRQYQAAFAYESRPGLTGADRMAAMFAVPLRVGTATGGLFRFGDDLYSEQIVAAGYSNQFGIASLGLKVNYIQYRTAGVSTKNAVSMTFGGIAQITPYLAVGAYIVNLNQPKLSTTENERLPTKLVAGVSLKPAEKFLWVAEVEKDLDYHPVFKIGMEYPVYKKIIFRSGANLSPRAAFFGLGFQPPGITIDYALSYATLPGFAHQASLMLRVQKKTLKK